VVAYLSAGFTDFNAFDTWLRADPVNRDDELFLLATLERGNMHDVVQAGTQQIQLTTWPEDFIISPDPAAPGSVIEPPNVATGDIVIVAALPAPAAPDRGHERVTLLNTTASLIDLTGWALADAAGGRQALSGTIAAGAVDQIDLVGALQLSNRGDTVLLQNPRGDIIDHVAYTPEQVRTGRTVCFGR
jgi:hypothetical protein